MSTPAQTGVYKKLPDLCCGVDIIIGIDEAGRGPVLGSLIYAAAFWPVTEDENIKKLYNFDDSKKLKEGERDKMLDQILSHPSIGYVIEEITAEDLSEDMLRVNPISLNTLSYSAVIRMLSTIRDHEPNPPCVTDVFVDTVGDPEFYKSKLTSALGKDYGNFIIEKKADAKYKVVSAASIIAKTTRDTLLVNYKWVEPTVKLDKNFGCGYPSDPFCVQWLQSAQEKVFGFPNIVRFSWSTAKDLLEDDKRGPVCCKVQWQCDEDEDTAGISNIKNFFGAKGAKKRIKRSNYFRQRKMSHVYLEDLTNT